MSRFINSRLGQLEEYVPGEQPRDMQYIKLNTNEFPYPPAPAVLERINTDEVAALRLYSDPTVRTLREKIAAHYQTSPENVFVGNGSDEVLNFAFLVFGTDGVRFADITYGFYPVFAALYDLPVAIAPLRQDFTVDPADYIGCGQMVVLASPNAPTGLCLQKADVIKILESNPDHVVVIDEAYVDFGAESMVDLTKTHENLLVVSTFSKSRALAGARVGFGIGDAALIRDLNRIKNTTNPYNINRLSMAAAEAAMDSQSYYDEKIRELKSTREHTKESLREMGFFVTDSLANFLFAAHETIGGQALYEALKNRGILVRHFSAPRIDGFVRITIGTPQQMEILLGQIKEILENGG